MSKSKGLKGYGKSKEKFHKKRKFKYYHYSKESQIKRNCKLYTREQNDEKSRKKIDDVNATIIYEEYEKLVVTYL